MMPTKAENLSSTSTNLILIIDLLKLFRKYSKQSIDTLWLKRKPPIRHIAHIKQKILICSLIDLNSKI